MQGITFGRMSLSTQIPRFSGKGEEGHNSKRSTTPLSIDSSPPVSDAEGDTVQFKYQYAAIGALQEHSKNLKQKIVQHQASLNFYNLSDKQRQTEKEEIQKLEAERKELKQVIAAKQKLETQAALVSLNKR